jgi:hypothetical protein
MGFCFSCCPDQLSPWVLSFCNLRGPGSGSVWQEQMLGSIQSSRGPTHHPRCQVISVNKLRPPRRPHHIPCVCQVLLDIASTRAGSRSTDLGHCIQAHYACGCSKSSHHHAIMHAQPGIWHTDWPHHGECCSQMGGVARPAILQWRPVRRLIT